MELEVALGLLVLPQVRETLIVDPQLEPVAVLHDVQGVLSDCEWELEGAAETAKSQSLGPLTACLRR